MSQKNYIIVINSKVSDMVTKFKGPLDYASSMGLFRAIKLLLSYFNNLQTIERCIETIMKSVISK